VKLKFAFRQKHASIGCILHPNSSKMQTGTNHLVVKPRHFLPKDFQITDWEQLKPYLDLLMARDLNSPDQLNAWIADLSELEAVFAEDAAWRQIRMTCDTTNKAYEDAFSYLCYELEPKIKPYFFELSKKLLNCPFAKDLDARHFTWLRSLDNSVALYREANIPLQAEMNMLAQKYGAVTGAMSIEVQGKEYTMQQAAKMLHEPDRLLRETVFRKIVDRRLQDK